MIGIRIPTRRRIQGVADVQHALGSVEPGETIGRVAGGVEGYDGKVQEDAAGMWVVQGLGVGGPYPDFICRSDEIQ